MGDIRLSEFSLNPIVAKIGWRCSFIFIGHCIVLLSVAELIFFPNLWESLSPHPQGSTGPLSYNPRRLRSLNHSTFLQRMRKHCRVGECAQSLEIGLADCPDASERHIYRDATFSGCSFDTAQRDDFVARRNELFGNEANVKSSIEASEKTLEHVLQALEVAATDRHPLWQIVNDVRCLETPQRLPMSWNGSLIESASESLVFFLSHCLSPSSESSFTETSSVRPSSLADFPRAPNVRCFRN